MNFCLVFGFLTFAQANTISGGKNAKDADYYTVSFTQNESKKCVHDNKLKIPR